MADEKKEYKYERMDAPKPVFHAIGRSVIGLQLKLSKHKETKKVFKNIILLSGFEGNFGFQPNKMNAFCQLPWDCTGDDLRVLADQLDELKSQVEDG